MSDKKGKAKSQNLPQRARKSRTKMASMPGRTSTRHRPQPIARNVTIHDPTAFKEGPISHPQLGRGQRFVGVQQMCQVATTASDSSFFVANSPSVLSTSNSLLISPEKFGGRILTFANAYARFCFRSITLEYEPYVATTQAGGGVLAIINDPDATASSTPDYTSCQDIVPSVTFALRDKAKLTYTYRGDTLFFTEGSTSTDERLTRQGLILGFPSTTSIGAIGMGQIRLHYVLDMFQPTPSVGMSLLGLTMDEKKMVAAYAESLRVSHLKKTAVETKESKDSVPTQRVQCSSSSSSVVSSLSPTVSSSGFQGPRIDERYLLVGSSQRQ